MNREPGNWRRLAEHVTERRESLGMTQHDVQVVGGPSPATLRHIEGAHQSSYKSRIIHSLERALRWESGSVQNILDGREALPSDPRIATPRELLANAMQARIDELNLNPEIIRYVIEEGVPPQRKWRELEYDLRWESGSIAAVLAGGEPTPLDNGDQPGLRAVPDADDERLDRLDGIADRLAAGLQEVRDELAELRRNRERDAGSHDRHGVR